MMVRTSRGEIDGGKKQKGDRCRKEAEGDCVSGSRDMIRRID